MEVVLRWFKGEGRAMFDETAIYFAAGRCRLQVA
jgi:hypothetical protein